MSDFLSRENELLGGQFSPTAALSPNGNNDEIDFDRAASAFPDIDLDGIPQDPPPASARNQNTGFSFEDFSPPRERVTDVKVTGDDELEKFENEFPDIGEPVSADCCYFEFLDMRGYTFRWMMVIACFMCP